MPGVIAQTGLLLKKNFLLKRRDLSSTLCEIGIPALLMVFVILIRGAVEVTEVPKSYHFNQTLKISDPNAVVDLMSTFACGGKNRAMQRVSGPSGLAIATNNDTLFNDLDKHFRKFFSDSLDSMPKVMRTMQCSDEPVQCLIPDNKDAEQCKGPFSVKTVKLQDAIDKKDFILRFQSRAELETYVVADEYGAKTPFNFGVSFISSSPKDLNYVLHVNRSTIPRGDGSLTQQFNTGLVESNWKLFHSSGVTLFQALVDSYFIGSNDVYMNAQFVPFPIPEHENDTFAQLAGFAINLFIFVGMLPTYAKLTKTILEEKEMKAKEGMKMMGLNVVAYWLSWILTYLVQFAITALLCTIILMGVFRHSSMGLVFVLLFLFYCSMIMLACFMSTILNSSKTGGVYIGIAFGLFLTAPNQNNVGEATRGFLRMVSLSSPVAFQFGMTKALELDCSFVGLTSDTINTVMGNFAVADAFQMLIIDTIIYAILAWYVDKVYAGEYGTALPKGFCFLPSFWCKKASTDIEMKAMGSEAVVSDTCQGVSGDLKKGIQLRNLTKKFTSTTWRCKTKEFTAVDNIDMDIFEGQVFVLLGHNGAGKTTTLNMLSGLMPSTSGEALIGGQDINTNMESIRQSLGVCPQHDILFERLTVTEHLEMYGRFKGIAPDQIEAQTTQAIADVSLEGAKNKYAGLLSGGQKRRLSMAIALIGDSKVCFLDEPTSGVDPHSRRAIWNVIQKQKKNRVIILTTHFMDEADALGDRICIMHHGKVRCCGTSLFLKRSFGIGYNITLSCGENANRGSLTELITTHVEDSKMYSSVGTELAMKLPLASTSKFPAMLEELETRGKELGCEGFGLSVTTMEEVFLKVAHEPKDDDKEVQVDETQALVADDFTNDLGGEDVSFCRHFQALFVKRWHNAKRDKKAAFCQFLTPWLILLFGLILFNSFSFLNPDALDFVQTFDDYNQPFRMPVNEKFDGAETDVVKFMGANESRILVLKNNDIRSLVNFSEMLLDTRMDHRESRYGAFCYAPGESFTSDDYEQDLGAPSTFMSWSAAQGRFPKTEELVQFVMSDPRQLLKLASMNLTFDDFKFIMGQAQQSGDDKEEDPQEQAKRAREVGAKFMSLLLPPEFAKTKKYNIYVNATALYGLPLHLTQMSQALLRESTADPTASLKFTISRMPYSRTEAQLFDAIAGALSAIIVAIGLAFLPAGYIVFIVKEKEINAKHLQLISGVDVKAYWISNFVFDLVIHFIASLGSIVIIFALGSDTLAENAGVIVLAMFLFGCSIIPFSYLLSFSFKNSGNAQNGGIMIFIASGVILMIVSIVFDSVDDLKPYLDTVRFISRLFPNYCLVDTIWQLSVLGIQQLFLFNPPDGPWAMNVSGWNFVFMGAESVVFFLALLVLEHLSATNMCIKKTSDNSEGLNEKEDADVAAERERIQSGQADDDLLTLKGVRRVFPSRGKDPEKVAVNNLHFSIPKNQCFGFLGVNGAGKSTTLKIITGDETPTAGDAFVSGHSVVSEKVPVRKHTGYCPQFDAVHPLMTAEETLSMFGRLRGVPEAKLPAMVQNLAKRLTLDQDNQHKRPAGTYSGGNRRKLSVGVALIGNPAVVLLDEPSTGMDPVSRRFMWNFIAETMTNRAVVLTTHSMEECEALCSRIGILVHGRMKCIGSSQHLKSVHGKGYEFSLNVKDGNEEKVKEFVAKEFENVSLLEAFGGNFKYRLGMQQRPLSAIFSLLENNRDLLGVVDYSIGQSTLEQIFINFAAAGDAELLAGQAAEEELNKA